MINVNVDIHREVKDDRFEWDGTNGDLIREIVYIICAIAHHIRNEYGSIGLKFFRDGIMTYLKKEEMWDMLDGKESNE